SGSAQANLHAAVGRMDARCVARTSGRGICRMVAAARGVFARCRSARSLGIISCRPNELVAAMGALRFERMGETKSREQQRVGPSTQCNFRNARRDVVASISL